MRMTNYTPGFVESYDQATRLCRVRIPGVTDGAESMPLAMLSYAIGDKSEHTEVRILPGDRVWLDFVNGDPRFPIITGFRPKETDNAIDWRRFHHQNIELQADTQVLIIAGGNVTVRAPSITLDGPTVVTGMLTYQAGITGFGSATSNGKNVSDSHTHGGVDTGLGSTSGVD